MPADDDRLLDAETLTTYTAPGGLLTRQLDAVVGTTVAIGLDPMIVASIRVLGTAAPAVGARLPRAPGDWSNEVFLLAYADADPAVTGARERRRRARARSASTSRSTPPTSGPP